MPLPEPLSALTDQDWLALLKQSTQRRVEIGGLVLPGFPPVEIQTGLVGSANYRALDEAFRFYTFVKTRAATLGSPINTNWRLLDFGVGWGRIIRFFLKDIARDNLYGVDVDRSLIVLCDATGVPAKVEHIEARGTLPHKDGYFDLVIAYSVFTHLPEPIQDIWLAEIARTLRTGGLFFATVQSSRTIEIFEAVDPSDTATPFWRRRVAERMRQQPGFQEAFRRRGFAYLPSRGAAAHDPAEIFGNAFVSPDYAARRWGEFFSVLEFCDDADRPQAIVVARKN
jgi:SAM-dependent methyltransferase